MMLKNLDDTCWIWDWLTNTIRRRCKRIKQFFAAAKRKRLIVDNPFDGIPTSTLSNNKRQEFISRGDIQKVIDACPNIEWKLIFALARYGGLRTPSELYGLTWDDIIWDEKRFIIHSPKTEHIEGKDTRICPLFPELEFYLMEAFQQAEEGQKKVINIKLDISSNLRTQAHRIIKRAGLKPWGKTFQNLRPSRETELVEDFPVHVVTEWLGNSPDIARKHYLQTHEGHFQRAVEKGGLNTAAEPCIDSQDQKRDDDLSPCFASSCDNMREDAILDKTYLIPPRGLEPLIGNSQGLENKALKKNQKPVLDTGLDISLQKFPELQQIITAWPELPEHIKKTIIELISQYSMK